MPVQHFGLANVGTRKPRKFRRAQINKDKWGRKYFLWIDLISGDPTGPIDPQFTAPVMLPPHCLSVPEGRPRSIKLHYRRYIQELRQAEREWEMNLARICEQLYGEKANVARPTRRALKLAGPKPQDWRLVYLAAKGDPWALGFQQEPTEEAKRILGERAARDRELEDVLNDPALREIDAELRAEEGDDLEEEDHGTDSLDDGDLPDLDDELEGDPDAPATASADADGEELQELEEPDDLEELEEAVDPEAVGGHRIPIRSKRPRPGRGRRRAAGRAEEG